MSNVNPPSPGSQLPRVVLLYKRNAPADEHLLGVLERKLIQEGFPVFVDRHLSLGVDWAKEIEQRVRLADAVVPLLSASSAQSEMLAFEIENAHEAAQAQRGHPRLLPIRVNHTGPLPEELAGILDPIQYILWEGEHDDERVAAELVASLKNLPPARPVIRVVPAKGLRLTPRPAVQPRPAAVTPAPAPAGPLPLEPVGGAVPLNSEFYTTRAVDADMRAALTRYDSIILVKGARQIGKTSLLARGLQFARERGAKVALTDFQKFNASNLEDVSGFFVTLAESLADQLDIAVAPTDVWDPQRGPSVNFERYIRREVLKNLNAPLVWGLDEVDRLFTYPYCSEVFGLFRSWHNERALDPSGPWAGLTLAITYATEAHLFITDMNQSPFNVGTKLAVEDFTLAQAGELNTKHGDPLGGPAGVKRFMDLVSGHPYLVRRGLQEMTAKKMGIDAFEAQASKDDGVYGDHLRRILVLLAKDPALLQVMSGVIRGKPCPNSESFYRLRSSGIVAGDSPAHVHPRCKLYSDYLLRHI